MTTGTTDSAYSPSGWGHDEARLTPVSRRVRIASLLRSFGGWGRLGDGGSDWSVVWSSSPTPTVGRQKSMVMQPGNESVRSTLHHSPPDCRARRRFHSRCLRQSPAAVGIRGFTVNSEVRPFRRTRTRPYFIAPVCTDYRQNQPSVFVTQKPRSDVGGTGFI